MNLITAIYEAWSFGKGEQVVENYGQPSHTYFQHHGFFIENSVYDCVHFTLSISAEEKEKIDWMAVQNIVKVRFCILCTVVLVG